MKNPFLQIILLAAATQLQAQTTLLEENFNNCGGKNLPAGWQVQINGNQDAVWYIGQPDNQNADSTSIDGSCMVVIDDDKTGDKTEGFVWDMLSPTFDASGFTTVRVSADVHYRDWNEAAESFQIWVTDGTASEKLLELGNDQSTGEQFSQFKNFKFDLTFGGWAKPNMRLIFRYDDGNEWDWWAGFDNVLVVGEGEGGKNVVLENFNGCQKPADWTTQILTGDVDWLFAPIQNPNYYGLGSMDGSCFAFFDDDILGDSAAYSTARLISPWFNGSEFANFSLNFDVVHRYWKESLNIIVQNSAGDEQIVQSWSEDVGGPQWHEYVSRTLDLSPFRDKQMRVIFEYTDNNDWGWWTGIDNVKITGTGIANDLCSQALDIAAGAACLPANNRNAVFEGPAADCAKRSLGGLWFRWKAEQTGWHKISSQAKFNEVVSLFSGGCANLQTELCNNRDEHGFTSETTHFQATANRTYLLRVSGEAGGYGDARGDFCLKIEKIAAPPAAPPNDNCQQAKNLTLDAPCQIGQNLNGKILDTQLPSRDLLARSDVWYSFDAPALAADERLEFRTAADFSDIITVWRGGCANLTEVASTEFGQKLELAGLTAGQTYRVQVAGIFATIEGNLCADIRKIKSTPPPNDDCSAALPVAVGGACVAANNQFAIVAARRPSCAVENSRTVWFKFVAPLSGSVRVNTGASFEHVASVWEGSLCDSLEEVFCIKNPLRCEGYFTVGELVPGKTYLLQIGASSSDLEAAGGEVCLKILDAINPPDVFPLGLNVSEICTGIGLATLKIDISGGKAPFQISEPAGGQPIASGTNYVVVARDQRGCEVSVVGKVKDCTESQCQLTSQVFVFQPVCHNASDGSISAEISSGTPPYKYVWSVAGQTGSTISGLAAGVYYLTATDAEGCETVLSRTLNNPPALEAAFQAAPPRCLGAADGSISVEISNGAAPFKFDWSVAGQAGGAIFNLPAGEYFLTATDANGCTGTFYQKLDNPPAMAASFELTNPTCAGGSDGSITVKLANGVAPIKYSWSVVGANGEILPGIPAGNYILTVTDANGCTEIFSATLTNPPALAAAVSSFTEPNVGLSNGDIAVALTNGTAPFKFEWQRNGQPFSTQQNLFNLPGGTYSLVVTDSNGCTTSLSQILKETVAAAEPTDGWLAVISPNPAHDFTFLNLKMPVAQDVRLSLCDAAGRILWTGFERNLTERRVRIDLAGLPAGIYQVKILASGGRRLARQVVVD